MELFLKAYWKQLVFLGMFFIILGLGKVIASQHTDLATKDATIKQQGIKKAELDAILLDLKTKADFQQFAIDKAQEDRLKFIKESQAKMDQLKKEKIPKDCQGAIKYAVDHIGDLQWPK